jgi:amino acid transporter
MVVSLDTLSGSGAPLLLVFSGAPPVVLQAFGMIAVVATINGVLIQTIMASRVLYGLADRGQLPGLFARVSPRTQTPVVATLVVIVLILLLSLTLPIAMLAERTSQLVLFVFVLVNLALIRVKVSRSGEQTYYRVPMVVPVLGVATSVLLFGAGFL